MQRISKIKKHEPSSIENQLDALVGQPCFLLCFVTLALVFLVLQFNAEEKYETGCILGAVYLPWVV